MGRGLVPVDELLQQSIQPVACTSAAAAVASGSRSSAAAIAEVPEDVTAAGVTSMSHMLTDHMVLASHSSQLYRCITVAGTVTPATAMNFKWSNTDALQNGGSSSSTASSHEEYFRLRYGVEGLRLNLPMLQVTESGRQKALQLVTNPLKPPLLQPGHKATNFMHVDQHPRGWINTTNAAAAAVDFNSLTSSDHINAAVGATAAEDPGGRRFDGLYLPLELCWVLPLPAAAWRELQTLPAIMYRINSLLRLREAQQQMARLPIAAGGNSGSSGSSGSNAASLPQPPLLLAALTGSSAGECFDMEGLEFLGDVVLKFLTINYLLQVSPPDKNEGELSVDKATLIRNVQLARIAQHPNLSLQHHLHLLPYQPDLYTPTGHLSSSSSSSSSSEVKFAGPIGLLMRPAQGSNQRPIEDEPFAIEIKGKRLADGVEALIGAVYLSATAQEKAAAGSGAQGPAVAGVGGVLGDLPVSCAGLAAAAAFCAASGVLPQGSAVLACQPCRDAFTATSNSSSSSSRPLSSSLQKLQQQFLGHTFLRPSLLQQALTHVSHSGRNYQRLEFLDDSVLDLYVSSWLMMELSQHVQAQGASSTTHVNASAELTWRRGALVNNTNLARAAAAAGLQHHMAAHSRPLWDAIDRFAAAQQQVPMCAGTASSPGRSSRDSSSKPTGSQAGATAGSSGGSTGVAGAMQAVGDFMSCLLGGPVAAAAGKSSLTQSQFMEGDWGEEDEALWGEVWERSGEQSTEGNGQVHAPKAMANIVESVVGAVLVDSSSTAGGGQQYNWGAGWKVVQQLLPSLRK